MSRPGAVALLAGVGVVAVGAAAADEAPAPPVGPEGPSLVLVGDGRVAGDTDAELLSASVGPGLVRVVEADPARWPAAVGAAAGGRPVGLVVAYAGLDTLAGPAGAPDAGVRALARELADRRVPLEVVRAPEGPSVPLEPERELALRVDLSTLGAAWREPTGWAPSARSDSLSRLADVSLGDGLHPTTWGRAVLGGWLAAELVHLWHGGRPAVAPEGPRATELVTWARSTGAPVALGVGAGLPAPGREGWIGPGGTFTVRPHAALGPLLLSFEGWVVGSPPRLLRGDEAVDTSSGAGPGRSAPVSGASGLSVTPLGVRVGARGGQAVTLVVPEDSAGVWVSGFTVVGGGVDPDHEGGRSRRYRVVHPAEVVPALDLLRGTARLRGRPAVDEAPDDAAVLRAAGQADCPPTREVCASGARWLLPGQRLVLEAPGLGAVALPGEDGTRPGTRLELAWTHWGPAAATLGVELRQDGGPVLSEALADPPQGERSRALRCVLDASRPVALELSAPPDGGAWLVSAARVRPAP